MKQIFILFLLITSIFAQTSEAIESEKQLVEIAKSTELMPLEEDGDEEQRKNALPVILAFVLKGIASAVIGEIVKRVFDYAQQRITRGNFLKTSPPDGGVWYSNIQDGMVCSTYYHPTKRHTASAEGGALGGGFVRSTANAGEWACACSVAGLWGRKTYYNVL